MMAVNQGALIAGRAVGEARGRAPPVAGMKERRIRPPKGRRVVRSGQRAAVGPVASEIEKEPSIRLLNSL